MFREWCIVGRRLEEEFALDYEPRLRCIEYESIDPRRRTVLLTEYHRLSLGTRWRSRQAIPTSFSVFTPISYLPLSHIRTLAPASASLGPLPRMADEKIPFFETSFQHSAPQLDLLKLWLSRWN